jgi:hypothetical protein
MATGSVGRRSGTWTGWSRTAAHPGGTAPEQGPQNTPTSVGINNAPEGRHAV